MAPSAPSGFTVSYTDPNSGAVYPEAWIQIRLITYVPSSNCQVVADAYVNQAAHQSGMEPVCADIVPIVDYGTPDWDTYFDVSIMKQPNCDIQSQALLFLQAKL